MIGFLDDFLISVEIQSLLATVVCCSSGGHLITKLWDIIGFLDDSSIFGLDRINSPSYVFFYQEGILITRPGDVFTENNQKCSITSHESSCSIRISGGNQWCTSDQNGDSLGSFFYVVGSPTDVVRLGETILIDDDGGWCCSLSLFDRSF